MDYKDTLSMNKSNFEMRGNLSMKEPILVEKWKMEQIYQAMNDRRSDAEEFILHDGPPYANGDMHCGHMLNRILKDFVVRYKNMQGYKTPFVFGWDTHGLPIENMVTKSGVNRKSIPIEEFRQKCHDYALTQVNRQREQIRRLGLVGDFDQPYLTLQKEYEAKQIGLFATMALKGYIYKGLKPVYWSPSSESALAEAEIEYADVTSHSIYVAFQVKDGKGVVDNDARFVIWTTTPWTLPANLAISAHPDFIYGEYQTSKGKLVFLKEFAERLKEELELGEITLLKEMKGRDLEYVVCHHPFYNRDSLVLVGNHVTNDAGTGLVHTAPGHGVDDYIVCQKYGIKPYCPVDEKGIFLPEAGEKLAGLFYEKGNDVVLDEIKNNGSLLKHTTIVHSYPHDWRTGKPLIFRATDQWFCSIEPIRQQLLEQIHSVKWYPAWGETRMINMIKDRSDWCISRQRAWGVPIPIFYNEDGSPIIEEKVFKHVQELIVQYGSNIWYEKEVKDLLPQGYTNIHSPHGAFTKEKDIMDVWFDSGSSFASVLLERGQKYPADLYLEGSDQYRGWFNSSLIISTAVYGKAPYKSVATHGWLMDEKWEKMSKSKGNGIDPSKIADLYGADILRLWTATVDYHQDVRISESIIKQVSEQYRKIRNVLKFISWNLADFDSNDKVDIFRPVDKYILAKLDEVVEQVSGYFETYDFSNALSVILTFISSDLSAFYLDISKDSLYCDGKDMLTRRQTQTVISEIGETLLRILNPVLPFTMDEFNANLPGERVKNVQLLDYPKAKKEANRDEILKEYHLFQALRDDVLKALEVARNEQIIGSSQEAKVEICLSEAGKSYLHLFKGLDKLSIAKLFIVSGLDFVDSLEGGASYPCGLIKVSHHQGRFCERCWNYEDDGLKQEDGTYLCHRCQEVIHK